MKKRKAKKIFFLLVVIVFSGVIIFSVHNMKQILVIVQRANGSSGQMWSYEMSEEGVLAESTYRTKRFFLNIGPGYQEVWKFKSVNQGTVTMCWIKYTGGNDVVVEDSYCTTYLIDEHLHITELDETMTLYEFKELQLSNRLTDTFVREASHIQGFEVQITELEEEIPIPDAETENEKQEEVLVYDTKVSVTVLLTEGAALSEETQAELEAYIQTFLSEQGSRDILGNAMPELVWH